ncbi:DUF6090 family protein [Winogradskyella maritima]|uniref:DUF6090 family protein n=1 Tax=Winogradskyella maritima TaxID=1517766 RepID=A0ABV8AHL3_9FLAO|nr:DUF6090 family protein [Winogradskyella maritima]
MENKTSKYFKYAIGEIILVVIGILIALQINNWNESRNTNNLSITYLNTIKKDLIADTTTFEAGISRFKKSLIVQDDILNIEKVNTLPIDSLFKVIAIETVFHSARIYQINNSTFSKLTNSGFVESKNFNDIFIDINEYYTEEYNTWLEYLEWDKENGMNPNKPEYLLGLYEKIDFLQFEKKTNTKSNQSINKEYELVFREYLKSTYFRNGAWNTNKQMKTMLERMKHQKNVASEMIEKINTELNK